MPALGDHESRAYNFSISIGFSTHKATLDLKDHPHRRFNPLNGDWVQVSPHRMQRPWQGQVEKLPPESQPSYDPNCYMCPGNRRATGVQTPAYAGTYVFDNDFPALLPDAPEAEMARGGVDESSQTDEYGLLVARPERGICRVVCFSPRHDLTVARMERPDLRRVVDVWAEQFHELGALPFINHVQIFENRGAMMGCSNPHPHGQIWANATVPNEPAKEGSALGTYHAAKGCCLLCDYLELERARGERLIAENNHFSALVPFWAVWPFEAMLIGRRHVASMDELTADERDGLADILKRLTTRYDRLFEVSFPYSMGFHQRPTDGAPHLEWHLHAHFYPPLLRSSTVRKFMVGYEMLDAPQRDLTPEAAAQRLRAMQEG